MITDTKTCGQCGAGIPLDAMMGLCRSCLFDYVTRLDEPKTPLTTTGFGDAGRRFADYTLGRLLGRGGMGIVYEAVQTGLRRPVALKMILDADVSSSTARRRFTLEAETAAGLDHPNIVPIYEVGEHQGQPFLSMKLIVGEDLRKKIASGELCLTRPENSDSRTHSRERCVSIVRTMATIAHATHHAHNKGVLHRDLKPANILVDQQGQPHLTDFGLAKLLGPTAETTLNSHTTSGTALGTPSYMSPEQAAGGRLTAASDVYSLGTILYEMLTGRPPFKAGTLLELLRLIAEQEPKTPSTHNPRIDKDLDTVCLKCLEKNPAARYPTAEALAEDLEHWLKGEPIRARRVGTIARTLRWTHRNPVGAGLIVSLCICLAVSLALLQGQRAKRKQADIQRQWAAKRIEQNIDNTFDNTNSELVTVTSSDLAALIDGPIPNPEAETLTFALNIPDQPVLVATRYAGFLHELETRMSQELGRLVSFDLQLYKARSWEALNGARKGADVQGMTFLTYVRLKEASPDVQPLVKERANSEGVIYAGARTGISNMTQVARHSVAFAHINSIISFLAKVELARSGVCAHLIVHTNLPPPRLRSQRPGSRQDGEADILELGNEGFAHREVLAKVLNGEIEIGVAPYRRFYTSQNDRAGLVELHRFPVTPDVYVARGEVGASVTQALRKSLVAMKDTAILEATKTGMRDGFEAATDSDFDEFRKLIANEWRFFETCQTNSALGTAESSSNAER